MQAIKFMKSYMMQLFKKKEKLIILIVSISAFVLSLWRISSEMVFIGDQAWFYLSARDFLLGNSFPLVGITSSHTWLHQGPLWTYLLSIAFWIYGFNPVTGAYLSTIINALTIFLFYILGKKLFSKQVAIIGATLYAFSPYIIHLSRMPYHTTPIPLLVILYFYSLSMWVKGKPSYFPWIFFLLALLYNFELATIILLGPVILPLIYGFTKKKYFVTVIGSKDLVKAFLLGLIPMLPVIIYDMSHGFKQTFGYAAWLAYTVIKAGLGLIGGVHSSGSLVDTTGFFLQRISWLIFLPNLYLGVAIFILSIVGLLFVIHKKRHQKESFSSYVLLILLLVTSSIIFIFNKIPSDAYLPIIFPVFFFSTAIASVHFIPRKILLPGVILFILLNLAMLLKHNYSMTVQRNISLSQRIKAVDTMISLSDGKPFRIGGKGTGSEFASFTMPYEYVAWYQGHHVSNTSKSTFVVEEKNSNIIVTQKK